MIDREHAITLLVQRMLADDARPAPAIWLGALEPWWAWEGRASGRLILSARRVRRRLSAGRGCLRCADVPVFLDSGAFSEVSQHGGWTWPAADFAEFMRATCDALGTVEHAGIQDWMCEPFILDKTGLPLEEHQRRTVANFCLLRRLQPAVPWVPTLQGYTAADYLRCAQMYRDASVDLDLVDFLTWKRERCPRTAAASQEFAETWRERQMLALAATIVDDLLEPRPAAAAANIPAELAAQLDLGLALSPPTRPAKPRAHPAAAPGAHRAPARPGALQGPTQGLLLGGPTA